MLAALGAVTRDIAVTVVIQHVLGIAAAAILFLAVRRAAGSPWPGVAAAAVVLLDTDEIFIEHNVMSEAAFVFILVLALYAAVRAWDAVPRTSVRWAVIAGALIAAAAVVRTAGAFALPPVAMALALVPAPGCPRWRAPAALVGVAAALLAGYALANLNANGRFELAPASGWHLYARVAPFADCRNFAPPAGTAGLCETSWPSRRWGPDFYLYAARSPARRLYGHIGSHDAALGAFALQAIRHQPGAYADAIWVDVRRYFVPSWRPHGWYKGWDIQPQLGWRRTAGPGYTRHTLTALARFFTPFAPHRRRALVDVMEAYEHVFGFGGAALTACTAFMALGLLVGSRRARAGILVFGVTGLAQLVGPTLGVLYSGRYLVPLAGPIAAGGAIGGRALWQSRPALMHRRRLPGRSA